MSIQPCYFSLVALGFTLDIVCFNGLAGQGHCVTLLEVKPSEVIADVMSWRELRELIRAARLP